MPIADIRPRRITLQGELLKVQTVSPASSIPHGAKRGNVSEFSDQSRMRMLQTVARIDRGKVKFAANTVKFITLTYPFNQRDAVRAKRDLKVMLQRIRREFDDCWVLWRMEYQKRGAIHFHLLCGNMPYWDVEQAQDAWCEVTGTTARNSLDLEIVRSMNGVMFYVAKYMAKPVKASEGDSAPKDDTPKGWIRVESPHVEGEMSRGHRYVNIDTGESVWTPLQARCASLGSSVSQKRPQPKKGSIKSEWVGRFWGVSGRQFMPYAPIQELFAVFQKQSWSWMLAKLDSEYCRKNTSFVLFGQDMQKIFNAMQTVANAWYNDDAAWEWSQWWQKWDSDARKRWSNAITADLMVLGDRLASSINRKLEQASERVTGVCEIPIGMLEPHEVKRYLSLRHG